MLTANISKFKKNNLANIILILIVLSVNGIIFIFIFYYFLRAKNNVNFTKTWFFETELPHINSETNPTPQVSASIWDNFLAQASVLLLFQYGATLGRWMGLILSAKWAIREFIYSKIFSGTDLASIIYVRWCRLRPYA